MKVSSHIELLLREEFSDFDQLSQRVRGFGLDWVQLDSGPVAATIQQVGLPSTLLSRFHFNRKYHQRGSIPADTQTFAVLSPASSPVGWGRDDSGGGRLVVFPTTEEFRFVSQPGFTGDTISISDHTLRAVAELREMDHLAALPPAQAFVEVDARQHAQLRSLLSAAHAVAGTVDSPRFARESEFWIASTLLEMIDGPGRRDILQPSPRTRSQVIRRALAFIEEHASAAPLIEDVCRASLTSWRTLDYAFRERFGMTPKHYLEARRLVGVRRELLNAAPGKTIGEIAGKWGFRHAGWFAAGYRAHFGELPSATLERGIAQAHMQRRGRSGPTNSPPKRKACELNL